MFVKGKSGNPSGRPKQFNEVLEYARSKTKDNLDRIAELAESAQDENVRLRASIALHEIAWGKPVQQQVVTGADDGPVQVSWLPQL